MHMYLNEYIQFGLKSESIWFHFIKSFVIPLLFVTVHLLVLHIIFERVVSKSVKILMHS